MVYAALCIWKCRISLKKIAFSLEYCDSCFQRILAKQTQKHGSGAVCSYCYRFLNKFETQPVNQSLLYPRDVPDVLIRLNSKERKLISQVHPYMTMLVLIVWLVLNDASTLVGNKRQMIVN